METEAKKLFKEAVDKLNEANKELYRPEEDIVSYSVCKNSQRAIENYLKGYLLKSGIDPIGFKTVSTLYEQCIKVNKKFEKIDFSDFQCKSHNLENVYCNEVSKVSSCFDIADSLDTFLRREKIL
ncbi:HEPN domain-containing protein [Litoribaculum gwangyangense]|uniref:HEPN domain-containing protein n=1 Tax=Litoribaculum gwangyangense TaxID=1130722 RepID=A0ABP9C794_9FLAO